MLISTFVPFESDLNKLVLDYLIIEGYRDAALSFAQELQDPDQQPIVGADDGQTRPTTSSSLFPGGDLFDFDSIHERMLIREAVESGRVDQAVRRVNELDSEVSVIFLFTLGHFKLRWRIRGD
jgi:hypothetical protein